MELNQAYYKINYNHDSISGFDNIDDINHIYSLGKNKNIVKLGIQAPPGTAFLIDGKTIYIGDSGLFELDDPEIKISQGISFQDKEETLNNIIIDYISE